MARVSKGLARGILVIAAGAIAAGCATGAPSLTPIPDPSRRIDLPGLSVLPPQGDNWFLVSLPPKADVPAIPVVTFVKKLRAEAPTRPADARLTYTRVTACDLRDPRIRAPATFEGPSAFAQWVREDFDKSLGQMVTGRHRLIGSEASPDASLGATCVRYSRLAELRGWGRFPEAVFMLATRGLYCLHPRWPRDMLEGLEPRRHLDQADGRRRSALRRATYSSSRLRPKSSGTGGPHR